MLSHHVKPMSRRCVLMAQPELQRPLQETLAEAEARIARMRRQVAEEEAKLRGLLPASLPPPPVLPHTSVCT